MSDNLEQLGWNDFFQQQISAHERTTCYAARISRIDRNRCIIWHQTGEHTIDTGLVQKLADIAVGDWLIMPENGHRPVRRLDRYSQLSRGASGYNTKQQTIAANIDYLFIVSSCNQDFNESRIERYLALAAEADIPPVLVLTKADLLTTDPEGESNRHARFLAAVASIDAELPALCVNAKDPEQLLPLRKWCGKQMTIVLVGSSGVGKSTLINNLSDACQKTAEVRTDDEKGRHTTTARSMHRLHWGGIVIDTPGIRELKLPNCRQAIDRIFSDVLSYVSQCRFRDCKHRNEPGCAVAEALASGTLDRRRWENYCQLQTEQSTANSPQGDRRGKNATYRKS